jgi:hypothetical protein
MAFFGCRLLVQVGNRCLVPRKKYRNKCSVKSFFICLNKLSGEQATEFYGTTPAAPALLLLSCSSAACMHHADRAA